MNVLHLTTHLNTGGITAYIRTLSKGLIANECSVTVMSSGGDIEEELKRSGVNSVNLDVRTKSELSPKLYRAIRPVCRTVQDQSIEVIHAHTRVTQVLAHVVSRKTRIPYVATAHGFFKPRIFRKLFPCWGDRTIAISEQVAEHIKKDFHVPEDHVDVVVNGIDLDRFMVISEEDRLEQQNKYGLTGKFVIGMLARLNDVKGQDILLRALPKIIRECPHAHVFLAGEGKFEPRLREIITELDISEYVTIDKGHGRVDEFLRVFDVFVNPSRMEGLGLSIMEAQASGLPVVATRVGGVPSLIVHAKTGYLVEPEDEGALAAMILKVQHNPVDARTVGLNAAAHASENYSDNNMTAGILDVYRRVVA